MEDVELEAAPMETSLGRLDDICPTDLEIAEIEGTTPTPPVEGKAALWSWSGVRQALVKGKPLWADA